MALLLVHDLLLAKKGIAASATHPLRLAIERHKGRLQAEFTRSRLRRKCATVEELHHHLEQGETNDREDGSLFGRKQLPCSRWVRINALKTTLEQQLESTFAAYDKVSALKDLTAIGGSSTKKLFVDTHVPDLIALSAQSDLTSSPAYRHGLLILQDKASCFPAYLLDPQPQDGDLLDACAAPGNKTTHLAALARRPPGHQSFRIWACERDQSRAETLKRMVAMAGADAVEVKAGQDFLRLDPLSEPWKGVGALLLDPSCSGSGMLGRDEELRVVLPNKNSELKSIGPSSRKRKRKKPPGAEDAANEEIDTVKNAVTLQSGAVAVAAALKTRLTSLSSFQLKLLLHAFQFPAAQKITYSTCSVYREENEHVVQSALTSSAAQEHGWRILRRSEQVPGMQAWELRGEKEAFDDGQDVQDWAEACIRCEKGGVHGTQGFFVAAFVRETAARQKKDEIEDEWDGFGDSD